MKAFHAPARGAIEVARLIAGDLHRRHLLPRGSLVVMPIVLRHFYERVTGWLCTDSSSPLPP